MPGPFGLGDARASKAVQAKAHQIELTEKQKEIAELNAVLDDNAADTLKQQLADLEENLARSAEKLEAAEAAGAETRSECEALKRQLEEQTGQNVNARAHLVDKVEKLEVQLRKQSKATAEAEDLAARTRAELEALEATAATREPDEVSGENQTLQAEVIKLEGMVRERTEQLNKLRWQQDMLEKQAGEGSGSKMLVVLNQQLASAREEYVLEIIDPAAIPYKSFNMSRKKKIVIGGFVGGLLATFAALAWVVLAQMLQTIKAYREEQATLTEPAADDS